MNALHVSPFFRFAILVLVAQQIDAAPPEPGKPPEQQLRVPADGISVPMLSFGGRPGLNVRINDQGPFPMVVDTGAMQTVIDASLAQELSLPNADGGSVIKQLEIGEATAPDFQVMTGPLLRMRGQSDAPRGVLSALAFPGYLLTFDFPRKQITIRAGALGEPNGKNIFSYKSDELPTIPVRVAGREFTVHLDTGAPIPLALPTQYKEEVPLEGPLEEGHKARTPSGEFAIYKGSVKGDIEIAGYKLDGHQILFSDAVPYPGATPQGQLGAGGLSDFDVTIDSANHRIEVVKPEG